MSDRDYDDITVKGIIQHAKSNNVLHANGIGRGGVKKGAKGMGDEEGGRSVGGR